ncbi:MAG: AraC family transcriptional regulator [Ruminiclostridium sp.]|nr:AraC family transcriptional regulator [Ruminiclostridium sp.]
MYKQNAVPDLIETNFIVKYRTPTDENPYIMVNSHYHEDDYEVFYLIEGERYYFLKDRTYHIKKGDLVLIDRNEIHKSSNVKSHKHKRVLVQFKHRFLDEIIKTNNDVNLVSCFVGEQKILRLDFKEQDFIEDLFRKMYFEQTNKQIGSELYNKVKLTELLLYINRILAKHTNYKFDHPNSLHEKISEVVKYLNENFTGEISLQRVSEHFFISPNYLCKIFKETTGFTLIEYLNQIRIKQAKHLLKNSSLNVSQIFEECGFGTMTHFERIFKKMTGYSPLKYRRVTYYGYHPESHKVTF